MSDLRERRYDRGRELATRAQNSIAKAQHFTERGDLPEAAGHALEAFLLLAEACLDRDEVHATSPQAVMHEYLARFGRGGRLYAAYYRWLLDAADMAHACALDLANSADPSAIPLMVERAQMYWESVDRFLDKTRG